MKHSVIPQKFFSSFLFFLIHNHYDLHFVSIRDLIFFVKVSCLMNGKDDVMNAIEFWESLISKSDKEIRKLAKQYGVDLTIEEIQQLRPLAQQANITWLITGIPENVLKQAEQILGSKKYKKYKKMLDDLRN
jgi:hypothetical protein